MTADSEVDAVSSVIGESRRAAVPAQIKPVVLRNVVAILGGLHIQFRRIQIFLLFYFYSFNTVFEDKHSAVLTS